MGSQSKYTSRRVLSVMAALGINEDARIAIINRLRQPEAHAIRIPRIVAKAAGEILGEKSRCVIAIGRKGNMRAYEFEAFQNLTRAGTKHLHEYHKKAGHKVGAKRGTGKYTKSAAWHAYWDKRRGITRTVVPTAAQPA